jgi:predicted nucleic acid-binding protein
VKVLLDVNVLADLFLKREAWLADAAAIWDANRTGRIRCCALASNIDTLAYLVRRNKGEDALAERDAVRACLESLEILVVTESDEFGGARTGVGGGEVRHERP